MLFENPLWISDNKIVTGFEQGEQMIARVDNKDVPPGKHKIQIWVSSSTGSRFRLKEIETELVLDVPQMGAVNFPVIMNFLDFDEILLFTEQFDIASFNQEKQYDLGLPFLSRDIDEFSLWPQYSFFMTHQKHPSYYIRRNFPKYKPGNSVKLLVDGNEALPVILKDLNNARNHIHIDWFFMGPDEAGNELADTLIRQASDRKVEVRVMFNIDATGKRGSLGGGFDSKQVNEMVDKLKTGGVKVYGSENTIPTADTLKRLNKKQYRDRAKQTIAFFKSRNISPKIRIMNYLFSVDHQKIIVIDGKVGFCGGMNCANSYLYHIPFDPKKEVSNEVREKKLMKEKEAWAKWHDVFLKVSGPAVHDLQRVFAERWAFASGEELYLEDRKYLPVFDNKNSPGKSNIKVLTTVPGLERDINAVLIRIFRSAKKKILVQNPYFTDDLLALFLIHAAKVRRIPVEVIFPDYHHDLPFIRQLMQVRYKHFLDAGIKIREYQNHMTHVKVCVVDSRYVLIGNNNFSKSSAVRDFECALLMDDSELAKEVERRVFDADRANSVQITKGPSVRVNSITELFEPYL